MGWSSGELRDWRSRGRFDMRHGHGSRGQRLLPGGLSLLQRGCSWQDRL